jgi:hypothetical protein
MLIKCPVCNKEKNIDYGKYNCSDCKSKFEYQTNGEVVLIKRNKFDFWMFFMAMAFPLMIIVFICIAIIQGAFYKIFNIPFGLFMIFHPLLITIRQLFISGFDNMTLIGLYFSFFSKELKKEDVGRQIGFYFTFITNITGVIWILVKLII